MIVALLLLQTSPDIEFGARVKARSVTIDRSGRAELSVRSEPAGGNIVDVQAPAAEGRRELTNVDVTIRAEARIADVETGEATTRPR